MCQWSGSQNSFHNPNLAIVFDCQWCLSKWDANEDLCEIETTIRFSPCVHPISLWLAPGVSRPKESTGWSRCHAERMKTECPSGTQLISLDGMKTALIHSELATPKRLAGDIFDRFQVQTVVNHLWIVTSSKEEVYEIDKDDDKALAKKVDQFSFPCFNPLKLMNFVFFLRRKHVVRADPDWWYGWRPHGLPSGCDATARTWKVLASGPAVFVVVRLWM